MYSVKQYTLNDLDAWNHFVAASKNGTFLFHRNFMEYHADRFTDFSLMVYQGQKLVALLPAHRVENAVYSHQGLTYGGLLLGKSSYLYETLLSTQALLDYLHDRGIEKLFVKQIPYFYHKIPAQELEYILFLCNAKTVRRDSLSVIENSSATGYVKSRRQAVRKGRDNNLHIAEDNNMALFWNTILIPNLQQRYGVKPVHSLQEIILLKERFPENIRHFNVYHNNQIVAGTTVFITDTVAHPQYISGNDDRNALGCLDFLYDHLIADVFKDKKFFDFGTSNEQGGKKLNKGLSFWKESYGARTVVQDFYEIETENYTLLNNVFL